MTSKTLHIAKDLTFPLDAVTQTFLVVGKRGSGKSNTAARFVEQLHHARLPFVVLDPVDTWWGLKASRDGGKGLDVYVFGGRKADLPLEAGSGSLIADVLCEHRLSMVLSVKHLSGRERSTFMVAFAQTLFQKWAGGPLHVVLEEAHELAPQSAQNGKEGEQQMLGAFKRLWKLGRASGIGGTAVTQRPASLSKDITTQSEILIAHRTIGPQDVKAVGEWVKYHGERLDILADLPTLPTGEAFVWAPEFPEGKAIGLQRTSVLLRETYDSASTPKVGEQRVEPNELAPVDLERLRAKMATTIEKAKADDPRELRKQIADLKRQVEQRVKESAQNEPNRQVKAVDKPVLTAADLAVIDKLASDVDYLRSQGWHGNRALAALGTIQAAFDKFTVAWREDYTAFLADIEKRLDSKGFQKILDKLASVQAPSVPRQTADTRAAPPSRSSAATRPTETRAPRVSDGSGLAGDSPLGKCERSILSVLAAHGPCAKGKLALLAGYTWNGSFRTALSTLRTAGLIEGSNMETMRITAAGKASGQFDQLPTGGALQEFWLSKFGKCEREILGALLDHSKGLTADDLCRVTNYTWNGSFRTALSTLRTAGVITGRNTETMHASEELFD